MTDAVTPLTPEQLRQVCDPAQFPFASTTELPPLEEVIGQERALRAIAFGIDIHNSGYHMYALGPTGTGKTTTIKKFLDQQAAARPVPDDWLYVNNFTDADRPRALRLPAGLGCKLKADMDGLVEELKREVPRAFEGAEYTRAAEALENEFSKRHETLLRETDEFAQSKGFAILQTPQGLMLAPVINGNVANPDMLNQLDEATRTRLEAARDEVQARVRETMRQIQQLHREANERGQVLDRETVGYAVGHLLDELRERYAAYPTVITLLDEINKDIITNSQAFKQLRQAEQMEQDGNPMSALFGRQAPTFDMYRVNLLVDHCDTSGAPVILARNPSYHNIVGRVEHQGQFGTLVTNFTMIKAGLLHKANGGYLMLDVRDVLTKPLAWEGLKRALKNGVVEMEPLGEAYGMMATRTLTPEPIPLDIKVVLIGDPQIYYLLYAYDPDFQELFKVKVDFAMRMPRTPETTTQYARFIATVCREEGLKAFDPSGVARVIEHSARLVSHKDKLDTRFGDVVDLVRQSAYWAEKAGHDLVTAEDVRRAVDEKVFRSNQIEELLQEMITEGTLLIDIAGTQPGQVNGLAVLTLGDYYFGKPSRVSARYHVGDAGVVSIDRETKLGGRIHNKGAMILAAYLGGKYATEVPMALSATLTFEQVYEEIEGDSASSTELYALLSALSDFPVRQELAVTGSVNQYGQVQAIGGVNEKIEGFFDTCKAIGLTGSQGVMIPASNVRHLMLRDDVVAAVRAGQFAIYPIATIDQGISLLTGRDAGERRADGTYPPGTVNAAVQTTLATMAQKVKAFMKPGEHGEGGEERREAA
jgi:lon-related putative ATP-dependent protease